MKNIFKKVICTVLMLAVIVPLATVNAAAAKPKINASKVNVPIGYSVTLKVTGASKVSWSSSDEGIASVKADGSSAKIYGKKTGAATISAKVGSTVLKCKVTVKKSFITASPKNITLEKGKSKTVTIKVSGSKDISVSNSDKDVCSASWGKWNGDTIKLTVKAKSSGSAVIKVYAKKYSKSTAQEITVNVSSDGEIIEDDDIKESSDMSQEDKVVELVNKERKAAGKGALESDDALNEIAAIRAKEIAESFSHTRPDGRDCSSAFSDAGYKSTTRGENIAMESKNYASYYGFKDSAESIMNTWMHSSGHKANILNGDFTKIGVGFYESGGRYYWVQVFAG